MGWKKVKEHYGIKHIVQVDKREKYDDKPCILIGSPYISDIIVIRIEDGRILRRYNRLSNDRLEALQPRLDEDEKNGTLKRLIDEEDTFENVKPVFFYGDYRHIIQMECEEYGWPNCTIDGKLMYENQFASTREEARKRLLNVSRMYWRLWFRRIKDRFVNIGNELRRFKYEAWEVGNFIYARCIGQFFVIKRKWPWR